jgi:DNA-binding MarR family transcriptional regulator
VRGQGRVLTLLKNRPETSQRELSYLLDMRQQSLSELLVKLEDKGYVTRSKSEEDGRVTVVRLTEEGARAVPDVNDMGGEADTFSSLSQEDLAKFEEVVDALTTSLKEKLVAMGDDPDDFHRGRRCRRGFGYGPRSEGDDDFRGRRHGCADPEDHRMHRA